VRKKKLVWGLDYLVICESLQKKLNNMLAIMYAPIFVRQFHKLPKSLQGEVEEKIELFKDINNHRMLKVHKLHGLLNNRYSFSVNYKYRIIFKYETKNQVSILAIGDHDVYQ